MLYLFEVCFDWIKRCSFTFFQLIEMAKKCVVRDTRGMQRQDYVTVCIINNDIQSSFYIHVLFLFKVFFLLLQLFQTWFIYWCKFNFKPVILMLKMF